MKATTTQGKKAHSKWFRKLRRAWHVVQRQVRISRIPSGSLLFLPTTISATSLGYILLRMQRLDRIGCQVLLLLWPPEVCNVQIDRQGVCVGEVPQECRKWLKKAVEDDASNQYSRCSACQLSTITFLNQKLIP